MKIDVKEKKISISFGFFVLCTIYVLFKQTNIPNANKMPVN